MDALLYAVTAEELLKGGRERKGKEELVTQNDVS